MSGAKLECLMGAALNLDKKLRAGCMGCRLTSGTCEEVLFKEQKGYFRSVR